MTTFINKLQVDAQLWRLIIPLGLVFAPGVITFVYIYLFAVNVPFWDEWSFVTALQLYNDGGNWLANIWAPAQPHRLFFPKLIFIYLAQLTNWNVVAQMYVSHFFAWATLAVLWLLYRQAGQKSLWGFVPVAWILFSLGQWENILWGWQTAIYLQVFASVTAIYLLITNRLWLAILAAVVSSLSFFNGLALWPIGFVLLALQRAKKEWLLVWSVAAVLLLAVYFTNFEFGESPSALNRGFVFLIAYALTTVGLPLGGVEISLSAIMGIYFLSVILALGGQKGRKVYNGRFVFAKVDLISLSFLLFFFLSVLLIVWGRAGFGHLDWAISSRYVTILSIGVIGVYWLALDGWAKQTTTPFNQIVFTSFLTALFIGLAAHNAHGLREGILKHEERIRLKYALQSYVYQPDSALQGLNLIDNNFTRRYAPFLEENELTSFADPMTTLFITMRDAGRPAGEITPNKPVIQEFNCPTPVLRDFGLLFATYNRGNDSQIMVTLSSDEGVLWAWPLSTSHIADNQFHYFILPEPVTDCAGRRLMVSIESVDGAAGNAVTVWTYPLYYEGVLRAAPDGELVDGRVIGLELNGAAFSMLHDHGR